MVSEADMLLQYDIEEGDQRLRNLERLDWIYCGQLCSMRSLKDIALSEALRNILGREHLHS